jgi:DNA-directed RNA polymerase specialized sigma24 family protein
VPPSSTSGGHRLRVRRAAIGRRGARRRRRLPGRQELSALDLVQAIRGVNSGRRLLEPIEPGDVQDAMRLLDRPEAQILAMLLADVPPSEIAVALSMPPATVGRRVNDISAACARTRP